MLRENYKSELLLPVGNYEMCLAAIHNGADAIYVGMPEFNARGRSHDHSWEQLEEIIQTCHLYGVKVNIAFNILIFQNELEKAINVLDKAVSLGPDALIVQDIGLISLISKRYPNQVIHGSTQMTVTNHEAIEILDDLNIKRFVLGRENSINEIELIKKNTSKELEVFVHGALCVAYSGQCFTSESLGGRSANRGQCAQSCRFDYDVFVDGKKKELGISKYLVSPQDLCGINEIPKLLELGIESFKVEGRLKSAEFVGTVAKNYKAKILDKLEDQNQAIADMGTTYSRGLYSGWLHGVAHQELVDGTFKENRGHFLGRIKNIENQLIVIPKTIKLDKGDGLLIVDKNNKEQGEKIYQLYEDNRYYKLLLGPKVDSSKLLGDEKIYITRKEKIIKDIAQSVSNRELRKTIPIDLNLSLTNDLYLHLEVKDGKNKFTLKSEEPVQIAKSRPTTKQEIKKNLISLSHTAYSVTSITIDVIEDYFVHNKIVKSLKQKMVAELNLLRVNVSKFKPSFNLDLAPVDTGSTQPSLNILLRKREQLDDVIEYISTLDDSLKVYINQIILDFEFGKDYFPSIKKLKETGVKSCIATTRILKPNEYHNFKLIERCAPDAILIRNLGALNYFKNKGYELIGDFSLNCTNSITHDYLINKGLKSVSASYDLNINQLNDLIHYTNSNKLEITLHQYMPEFHMEHCVFAAFLSDGNSFRDCGKPCEKHDVHLKDMYGNRHEIKADQECRNTMFNSKAQSTAKYLTSWINEGVSYYRFECLHETSEEIISKISTYINLMAKKIDLNEAYSTLGKVEKFGLGAGVLNKEIEYQSRKK